MGILPDESKVKELITLLGCKYLTKAMKICTMPETK